jgi:hypothetical protein
VLHIRPVILQDVALLRTTVTGRVSTQLALVTIGEEDLAQDSVGENPRFRALVRVGRTACGIRCIFWILFDGGGARIVSERFIRACGVSQARHRKALLADVARSADEERCSGIHWEVLDWNNRAIESYKQLGATFRDQWRAVLLTDEALRRLAEQAL